MQQRGSFMADSMNHARFLNPWVLHIQKLGLELKCPLCLNLFNQPMLLPCNHIFCFFCLPKTTQIGSECPVCKVQFSDRDLRPAPFMDNMITIYRSLDTAFCASLCQPSFSDAGRVSEPCPASINDVGNKLRKEGSKTALEGNLGSGGSIFSFTASKRVQLPFNHSVEDGLGKNEKFNKCSVPRNCEDEEFENCKATPLRTQSRDGGYKCGPLEMDMNKVAQSSQGSPISFGDIKGLDSLDDNSSDQGSEHSPEKYSANRLVEHNSLKRTRQERNNYLASGTEEGHARDLKRLQQSNYGPLEIGVKSGSHYPSVVSNSVNVTISNSGLEPKSGVPLSGARPSSISESSDGNRTVCGFCQSSKVSEATGPMLHYATNGKLVVGDDASCSDVIHVHKKCIEWAPQVYFVGETIKNLKKELARGAKLKCSRCGLKGAALGCYAKSCRKSFHVPCAMEVVDCRWDCENFLVLCPSHCSLKFPNEKSKFVKHVFPPPPTQMTSQQANFWAASPNGVKELVLCGSAVSAEEKFLLVKFASMSGASVSKFWKPNVTHVIAATDVNGACSRTLKVLMAILNGKWVLKIDWIKACMEAMHPVDEEPYEVSLDNHGCLDGPKTGRIRTLDNAPRLFNGFNFYFSGDFVPAYKEDLQNLVIAAGGSVLRSKEDLVAQIHDAQATTSTTLVVYNLDPPQGCKFGEEVSIASQRLEAAMVLAAEIGSQVIGHTWLLESIASCKLQPFAR